MNRSEYLFNLLVKLVGESQASEFTIEFRGKGGWVLVGAPRHFGDDGADFLGKDWKSAEKELQLIFRAR